MLHGPAEHGRALADAQQTASVGVLFGPYHLHQPWTIPSAIVQGTLAAHAGTRFRSSLLGVIAHSAQSVFFIAIGLVLVLS